MDDIQIDPFAIKDFQVDVGVLPEGHSALLELDILKKYKFVIDLNKLEPYPSKQQKKD